MLFERSSASVPVPHGAVAKWMLPLRRLSGSTAAQSQPRWRLPLYAVASLGLSLLVVTSYGATMHEAIIPLWLGATFLAIHTAMMNGRANATAFRQLFTATFEGVAMEAEGTVLDVHDAVAKALGHEREQLIGRSFYDLLHPSSAEAVKRHMRSDSSLPIEAIAVRGDGTHFAVELTRKSHVHDRHPLHFVALRDISARKESELQGRNAERLAALGTLAQNVGYDVSNPLFLVVGNLELCQKTLQAAAADPWYFQKAAGEMAALLEDARAGAEKVRDVIRDLKTLSFQDANATATLDVNQVLEASTVAVHGLLRSRARLTKDFHEAPTIHGNGVLLEQVFVNLLLNAAEAIQPGDTNRNEIRLISRPAAGNRVMVEVTDTGHGMDEATVKRIFEPYFTTRAAGRGLGLSICRKTVLAMGGDITVDSTPGRGTTVRLYLPACARKVAGHPVAAKAATPPARPKMLIIDDDMAICKLVQRVLSEDHDVDIVTDGGEAMKLLPQFFRYDVILCDLHMPGITGMDLYEEARRRSTGVERRIVFITGGAFTQRSHDFLRSIPNLCVEKPIQFTTLTKLIRNVIERAPVRARAEAAAGGPAPAAA